MSDGPYRSLPMSRWWKRLAKFSENENFASADMCGAAIQALWKTCRAELPPNVLEGLCSVFLEQQPGLFPDHHIDAVEVLRPMAAGHKICKLLLDHATYVLHEGGSGEIGLTEAAERMLTAVGESATRQIEEHYLRKDTVFLTRQVVGRVEQALGTADKRTLARRLCGLEWENSKRASHKHKDINDGVPL